MQRILETVDQKVLPAVLGNLNKELESSGYRVAADKEHNSIVIGKRDGDNFKAQYHLLHWNN
jgi:hypothetical protein